MPKQKHSKESIIASLQNLASRLNKDTLSKREVSTLLPTSVVNYHFGCLGNALEAAGLKRMSSTEHLKKIRKHLSDNTLFQSIYRVEQQLGRKPTSTEYSAYGDYSPRPFRKRFGPWNDTLKHYDKWKNDHSVVDLEPNTEADRFTKSMDSPVETERRQSHIQYSHMNHEPDQLYGEPIDFRGLRHAPINEQGVVYLFGMVSRELGFYIEAIQQGFPDCEGKHLHNKKKNLWAKARIEFEFRASSFREHGHDPNKCDFVVCWINDWPECPVSVIELRKEILKLPAR